MKKIQILDKHIANLIAAGEVVERPASVVKELMENAIDANARIITVEIKDGGMTYIRVTDDGSGISAEDAETAFKRHATSKLRKAEDLEAIGTLGFRGEALAAIAAVSRIELLSKTHLDDSAGVRLVLEAGDIKENSPAGCSEGTSITIRDLFFNTPARHKFIKSNRAEAAAITVSVLRTALSHPDISIRFIKDGKTEYHTPGDCRVDSCIYSLFGREFSSELIPINPEIMGNDDHSVCLSGYVSKPETSRGSRSYQFFIVNGRPVRSLTLQAALEQAYINLIPHGRFPACILYITTRLSDIDVNIHPTKAEIKFSSEKDVFNVVYYSTLGALGSSKSPQQDRYNASSGSDSTILTSENIDPLFKTESFYPNKSSFKTMSTEEFKSSYSDGKINKSSTDFGNKPADQVTGGHKLSWEKDKKYIVNDNSFKPLFSLVDEDITIYNKETPVSTASEENKDFGLDSSAYTGLSFNVIGEALNTYILAEAHDSLWLIDKHAAHERIRFNELKSNTYEPMSQALIVPVICRMGAGFVSTLLDNSEFLESLGFSVDGFGEDSIAVRLVPSDINISELEPVLSSIAQLLESGNTVTTERLDNIYRTIACHSSLRAGSPSVKSELYTLTGRVLTGEITHCPHGRPVMFELTKYELDKIFKRIL